MLDFDDEEYTTCVSQSCCAEVEVCTAGDTEQQACIDCLFRGSGDPRCNDLINCAVNALCLPNVLPVCDGQGYAPGQLEQVQCVDLGCCADIATCTEDGTDPSGCQACVQAGGGARCDAMIACFAGCDIVFAPVCNAGINAGDAELGACLGEACCEEFNECTGQGTEADACSECFLAGGTGEQCASAVACLQANCAQGEGGGGGAGGSGGAGGAAGAGGQGGS